MTWRTHAVIGANTLWLAAFFGTIGQSVFVLLPAAVIASLLPDIDATSAKIHYMAGGILSPFRGAFSGKYFHHRGMMHSLLVTFILFLIVWFPTRNTIPALSYVVALSYASHIFIDGFNTMVGYFYPFSLKRFALLPRFLRSNVDGPLDRLLFFARAFGLLLFFYLFARHAAPNFGL